jgi:hypothetical protein
LFGNWPVFDRPSRVTDLTQKITFQGNKSLTEKGEKVPQIVELLPANEGQIRPLLNGLKTDSERVKVWQDVVYDSQSFNTAANTFMTTLNS